MSLKERYASWCKLVVLAAGLPLSAVAAPLFDERFDDVDDWTSGQATPPDGWYHFRATPTWAPSTGHRDRHESIEIVGRNASMARGGSGKSAVFWRESQSAASGEWSNDKILAYRLPTDLEELYVEFFIRFSPDWRQSGIGSNTSKIFRMYAFDPAAPKHELFHYFSDGHAGPIFLWRYEQTAQYGLRNFVALRGGPYGDNYYTPTPKGFPRDLRRGDASLNFTLDTVGHAIGGGTPTLRDKVNGGSISDNLGQTIRHAQIFGRADDEQWTKVGFYVRMNSSGDTADGVVAQWIDDERILYNDRVLWTGPTGYSGSVNWNVIAIGGNDHFDVVDRDARYEEWYAIDDLRILDHLPVRLGGEGTRQHAGGTCR